MSTSIDERDASPPLDAHEPPADTADRRGPGPVMWIAMGLALLLLGGAIGWRIGKTSNEITIPGATSVDVGFFEDMTTHHNQAIAMASIYLEHGTDPLLRQVANEILLYQASEIGVMNNYVSEWGQAGNAPTVAMRWMGMSMPRDQMMGMATKEQMQELGDARGAQLDDLFTTLMIRHHEAGVQMADYAHARATTDAVRTWSASMADGQKGEIAELNRWRVEHDLPAVKVNL